MDKALFAVGGAFGGAGVALLAWTCGEAVDQAMDKQAKPSASDSCLLGLASGLCKGMAIGTVVVTAIYLLHSEETGNGRPPPQK